MKNYELRAKEKTHKEVMKNMDKDSYELEQDMYNEVLDSLKKKDKKMFKLLNKSGRKYKDAIYWYMRRIFSDEEIPMVFQMTWLIAICKRKGSALDLNMM